MALASNNFKSTRKATPDISHIPAASITKRLVASLMVYHYTVDHVNTVKLIITGVAHKFYTFFSLGSTDEFGVSAVFLSGFYSAF